MTGERSVQELRLGLYATPAQARELKRRIEHLLCPDPDHAPPCPVPWSAMLLGLSTQEAREAYPELLDQARAERHPA
ncbi:MULTISPECIES: hypothetical protein [unclassified Streptomyces]|uniref:Uncharacterized protein n=1 Tax=Streptomyces evansiae TaxID=3075535 RepID=A0ABD5EEB8_9ACTN|nr:MULTISPECIES: hypothetical protein [unclassified Streptomyces]ASY34365.1 hypothetical protein CAC01_18255 [Streptomyces sp. CLI2509]EFL00502.1 predicted protein [Streptomyces sp. SPB78]MDT0412597.1 hypothetical protein [Streptomyces sp. DSM 41979]MDT0419408.1 hypothetical protein [Streptomyces sp. DSM 41982]MDT0425354.1 hypothetical protein [Streptomyces sp. DSM 41859]